MDNSHKMITGREWRGTPHEVVGLLVEAIWLVINEYRHRLARGEFMFGFYRKYTEPLMLITEKAIKRTRKKEELEI